MRRRSQTIAASLALSGVLSLAPAVHGAGPRAGQGAGPRAGQGAGPRAGQGAGAVLHVTPQGRVTALVLDPRHTATLYAATDTSGVYRSANGGATWDTASGGLPDPAAVHSLVVDPSQPATLYAAGDGGVYKTINSGLHWSAVSPPTDSPPVSLTLDPTSSSTIYAGTHGDGIYRSTNAGATWSAIGPRLTAVQAVVADPTSGTTLYAGTDDGLLISSNRPVWRRAGLGHVSVLAVGLSAADPTVVYAGTARGALLSRDGGMSWARIGFADRSITTLYVDSRNAAVAYAASSDRGGIFLTTNYGHSWLPLVAGLSSPAVLSFALDPSDARVAYAGLERGVFKSLQGGRSWASSSIYDRSVYALLQPPVATGLYYAGTNGGVYASNDGGNVWTAAGLGNHRVAALVRTPVALVAATESGIYRTTDGGHRWPLALHVAAYALLADPAHAGALFAGTYQGLFHSTDDGVSWSQLSAGTSTIAGLLIRPDGALLAGAAAGVLISSDNGASFKRYSVGGESVAQVLSVQAVPPRPAALFARTGAGRIFRSLDGGVHWIDSSVGEAASSSLAAGRDGRLYAATERGIYRSSSGGVSWILTDQQDARLRPLVMQPADGGDSAALLEGLDGQGVIARSLRTTPSSPFAPIVSGTIGRYVAETGHFVRAPFLDWYVAHNGPAVFGPPRTEAMREGGALVQYFQNAQLIYHPDLANTPQVIGLAPLGAQSLGTPVPAIAPFDNTTTRRFFSQTGHSLAGEFLQFWRAYGGMAVFGYPIGEPTTDAAGVVVQYFQNVRLEASAGAGTRYFDTRLSALGDDLLRQRGWLP